MTKRDESDAYDEGRNACAAHISAGANPWPVFDHRYQQWALGWMDEQRGIAPPKPKRRRGDR